MQGRKVTPEQPPQANPTKAGPQPILHTGPFSFLVDRQRGHYHFLMGGAGLPGSYRLTCPRLWEIPVDPDHLMRIESEDGLASLREMARCMGFRPCPVCKPDDLL